MTGAVLDAWALLALTLGEPGSDQVRKVLDGAWVATVNLAEVVIVAGRTSPRRSALTSR